MGEPVKPKIWNRFLFPKIYEKILYTWENKISQPFRILFGNIDALSLQL